MNCDQCKEEIFELIEREATDPEGVREILSNCPDCRAEFQEMKATLALARELPIEQPSAHLDAAILQLAEARQSKAAPASKVVLLRRQRIWNQPWAMAAVALLAVGIGISTVSVVTRPEDEKLAQAPSPTEMSPVAAPPEDFEQADEAESAGRLVAEVSSEKLAAREPEAKKPPASRRARAMRRQSPKKKEARDAPRPSSATDVEEQEPQRLAKVQAEAENDTSASQDATSGQKRRCASKVSAFEKQLEDDKDYAPTPEEQLSAGLCYQTLGKRDQAQRWLRRAAQHSSTSVRAKRALQQLD